MRDSRGCRERRSGRDYDPPEGDDQVRDRDDPRAGAAAPEGKGLPRVPRLADYWRYARPGGPTCGPAEAGHRRARRGRHDARTRGDRDFFTAYPGDWARSLAVLAATFHFPASELWEMSKDDLR